MFFLRSRGHEKVSRLTAITAALCFASVGTSAFAGSTTYVQLNAINSASDITSSKIQLNLGTDQLSSSYVTTGTHSLRVAFNAATSSGFPSVMFMNTASANYSQSGGFAFDVTNPGSQAVSLNLVLVDNKGNSLEGPPVMLQPNESSSYYVPLGSGAVSPITMGMTYGPNPFQGLTAVQPWANSAFNAANVVKAGVFMRGPTPATVLYFDNVRLLIPLTVQELYTGIVDQFGQYTQATWTGKINQPSDLTNELAAENADLAANPPASNLDSYGGWLGGPQEKATGFFRTQNVGGKWWFVTPTGHLFFSMGINNVTPTEPTFYSDRTSMFTSLPASNSPLAAFYGNYSGATAGPVTSGQTFDFYGSNLYQKYGANYHQDWMAQTKQRLPSWGFNTIGNWSDPSFFGNSTVPYVVNQTTSGNYATVNTGLDYWGSMPDPYDPNFAKALASNLSAVAAIVKNDPMCLGYYIDNELSWIGTGTYQNLGIATGVLALDASKSPAKAAMVSTLISKYGTVAKLNAAWGAKFASWSKLSAPSNSTEMPTMITTTMTAASQNDCNAFVQAFATQYFRVVSTTLKSKDPNHLYLGCRFSWFTPAETAAAAQYCDVVSFNYYGNTLDSNYSFTTGLGKPCIVGEFSFGAADRGMFGFGLNNAGSQANRATMFTNYVNTVLTNPAFVGCHWFQYTDQPLTGRPLDGENFNMGLVDVSDTPYPALIAAARALKSQIYTIH